MKFFLAILTVALLARVSFAASIRSRRDADEGKSALVILKEVLAEGMPILTKIVKLIPETSAYDKYRGDINDILKLYETKQDDMLCIQKSLAVVGLLKEFRESLDKDTTVEGKKVLEIFESQRDKTMSARFSDALKNAAEPSSAEILEEC